MPRVKRLSNCIVDSEAERGRPPLLVFYTRKKSLLFALHIQEEGNENKKLPLSPLL